MQVQHVAYKELTMELEGKFQNPREFIDQRELRELADSIEKSGLLYPLQVWKTDGHLVVVEGGRRLRAIGLLIEEKRADGLKVPIVYVDAKNEIDAREAALVGNLQRVELTSYEIAKEIFALKEAGLAQADIADRLKKSQSWVSRQLKAYGAVSDSVRKAWKQRKLPDDDVQTLASLPPPEQEKRLEKLMQHREAAAVAKPGEVRKAKSAARAAAKGGADKAPRALRPDGSLIKSFADLTSRAPKTNKYVVGMSDAFRFMLGEIGPGEFGKDFRDWANTQVDAGRKALPAGKPGSKN
jgi:ParB/RepB/Spo0J family partition protein